MARTKTKAPESPAIATPDDVIPPAEPMVDASARIDAIHRRHNTLGAERLDLTRSRLFPEDGHAAITAGRALAADPSFLKKRLSAQYEELVRAARGGTAFIPIGIQFDDATEQALHRIVDSPPEPNAAGMLEYFDAFERVTTREEWEKVSTARLEAIATELEALELEQANLYKQLRRSDDTPEEAIHYAEHGNEQ